MGINCHFDPETCVKTVKMMKDGVEKAGLKAHYMCQPLAYHTPDCNRQGFIDLPEFPFGTYPVPATGEKTDVSHDLVSTRVFKY